MAKKIQTFNDGMVNIYKSKTIPSSFNAAKNVRHKKELELIVKLAFEEMSKRDQDLEFASSLDRNLSLKIKTRYYKNIDSTYKAVVGNVLYSILKIDFDKSKKLSYIYLEEERLLDE